MGNNQGDGLTKNHEKGLQRIRKAAEEGNADAECRLGLCYYFGHGVAQDYTNAVIWFRKAAEEQGNVKAQFNLGFVTSGAMALSRITKRRSNGIAKPLTKDTPMLKTASKRCHQRPTPLQTL